MKKTLLLIGFGALCVFVWRFGWVERVQRKIERRIDRLDRRVDRVIDRTQDRLERIDEISPRDFVMAIAKEQTDIVRQYLDAGGDVNARNEHGDTALMWAVNQSNAELTQILLERGADPALTGSFGVTPIHWAAKKGNFDMVRLLLEQAPETRDQHDAKGDTPLIHAARANRPEIVRHLLDQGAAVDAPNQRGETALLAAVQEKAELIVEPLMSAGADIEKVSRDGWSPASLAVRQDWTKPFTTTKVLELMPDMEARLATHFQAVTINRDRRPEWRIEAVEELIHAEVNRHRREQGLRPLEYADALGKLARAHSQDMATRNFFNHVNPDGQDPTDRARRARLQVEREVGRLIRIGVGENIYQAFDHSGANISVVNGERRHEYLWINPEQFAKNVAQGWMDSPGHRRNMLDPDYRGQGIGVALTEDGKVYVTQNLW